MASTFQQAVWALCQEVPAGAVTTYGDVAAVLGHPRAARQVGYALAALRHHPDVEVPWHRVINAQGGISHRGEMERPSRQRERLEAEGISFDVAGFCDLQGLRWPFPGHRG
jgi:methylated-DNA-protein-cysteine methyltransferase-like protein